MRIKRYRPRRNEVRDNITFPQELPIDTSITGSSAAANIACGDRVIVSVIRIARICFFFMRVDSSLVMQNNLNYLRCIVHHTLFRFQLKVSIFSCRILAGIDIRKNILNRYLFPLI